MQTKTIESAALVALVLLVLAVVVAVRPAPPKATRVHCHDGSCHAHR